MTAFTSPPTIKNTRQVQLKLTDIDLHNDKPLADIHISNRYPYDLRCLIQQEQDLFKIRMTLRDNNKTIFSQCYAPQSSSFYFKVEIPCEWFGRNVDVLLSSEEERLVGTLKLPSHAEIVAMP
ncbi:predicted protein [Naegleria gruberi]|uniref:Predicted protein n=1 Tax=Naegleria gruberi TaxID=5762 RepID=D2VYS6_NAEGR|nr:uncharacterized protein NAEGRDRAFT_81740 [Naegleria gruberi]EFC38008.1 predicted protein [Naegleria gruberi]|eukprot:XP_002670752.1 predicted protein [Naegleria gruberi strain NEG-M]